MLGHVKVTRQDGLVNKREGEEESEGERRSIMVRGARRVRRNTVHLTKILSREEKKERRKR